MPACRTPRSARVAAVSSLIPSSATVGPCSCLSSLVRARDGLTAPALVVKLGSFQIFLSVKEEGQVSELGKQQVVAACHVLSQERNVCSTRSLAAARQKCAAQSACWCAPSIFLTAGAALTARSWLWWCWPMTGPRMQKRTRTVPASAAAVDAPGLSKRRGSVQTKGCSLCLVLPLPPR